jgi:hypothetical protein
MNERERGHNQYGEDLLRDIEREWAKIALPGEHLV